MLFDMIKDYENDSERKRRCKMKPVKSPKTLAALVVISVLLMLPFTQFVWAKAGGAKGEYKKEQKIQQMGKSQPRSIARTLPAPSEPAIRRNTNSLFRLSRSPISRPVQREPQSAGMRIVSPASRVPDITRRIGDEKPTADLKPVPSKKDERETKQSRIAFRIGKGQGIIRLDKTEKIAVPIETPKVESAPRIERKQNVERTFEKIGREGKDIDRARDKDRPTKKEIVGKVSENRTSKETRRPDRDQPTRFRKGKGDAAIHKPEFVRSNRSTVPIGSGDHGYKRFKPTSTGRVIYEDHVAIRTGNYHFNHIFRDRHSRLCHRIIWPRFHVPIFYNWGHCASVHYVYPFYHRRYIFVSLGGFWPDYTCLRYYWYPAHFYWWYGYEPVAQEVSGDTYNYYTYNYYGQQTPATTESATGSAALTPVDHNTFADVREKLARQKAQGPAAQMDADTLFDEGVKAFGQGDYTQSELKFAQAIALEPNDIILPFAYAQTMLAEGKYYQAADMLRLTLQKSSPEQQGVYFPRGLYLDENTLMDQIDLLAKQAQSQPTDSNLQLLLGYQLLGIGETEKAIGPLQKAKEDSTNSAAATMLLELAEKIKAGETE
jgi:hypothetical protein